MANQAPKSSFDPVAVARTMEALQGLSGNGTAGNSDKPTTPKATIYIAIGTPRDGADIESEDFDLATDMINLPQMQGLDNMNPDTRKAGTQEFADQQALSNDFLEDLREQALATMQPGERRLLPLYVTVYKVKDQVVAQPAPKRQKRSFF